LIANQRAVSIKLAAFFVWITQGPHRVGSFRLSALHGTCGGKNGVFLMVLCDLSCYSKRSWIPQ